MPLHVAEQRAEGLSVLVEGNLIKSVSADPIDADPEWKPIESLDLIMKDGVIYKNTL